MTFDVEITTDTMQKMKVMQQDMDQKQAQVFRFRWTVQGRDTDDNWLLSQKVEHYHLDVTINGNRFPVAQRIRWANFRQALVGSEFTVMLSPHMKVTRIEGRDRLANRLADIDPQLKFWLEPCFSEDFHMQLAQAA